jgi:hypothetical protein
MVVCLCHSVLIAPTLNIAERAVVAEVCGLSLRPDVANHVPVSFVTIRDGKSAPRR